MGTMSRTQFDYALGHSEQELLRLSRQGQAFRPFTHQLLEQAGISPGMRILDIGSGAGDVSFLAAELVGPKGYVVGVDRSESAVAWATARARSQRFDRVQFLLGDPTLMEFDPFDAVVGRFVLMYYPDPGEAVRSIIRHLRPGGLIAFQEFAMDFARSQPPVPTFERAVGWLKQTLSATGARIQLGMELYPLFLACGLPSPCLRLDVLIGGGPSFDGYELTGAVIQSLLPSMEQMGIATSDDVQISTLAERIRDEVVSAKGFILFPALVGAWSRKKL
jgi:SAM-dependent methyltransferase